MLKNIIKTININNLIIKLYFLFNNKMEKNKYINLLLEYDINSVKRYFDGLVFANEKGRDVKKYIPSIFEYTFDFFKLSDGNDNQNKKIILPFLNELLFHFQMLFGIILKIPKNTPIYDISPILASIFIQSNEYKFEYISMFIQYTAVPLKNLLERIVSNQTCEISYFYEKLEDIFEIELSDINYIINFNNQYNESNINYLEPYRLKFFKESEKPIWLTIRPDEISIGKNILNNEFHDIETHNPTEEELAEVRSLFYENIKQDLETEIPINIESFLDNFQNIVIENSKIYKIVGQQIDPDRIYGPTNPIDGLMCDFNNLPCRMLSCTCENDNWFNNYCTAYGPILLEDGT